MAGKIIFTYKGEVISIIDVDEASLEPKKKVKIVEDKLDEMVRNKMIKKSEKFSVEINTERFPPPTFLSSTHFQSVNSK